MDLHKEYFDIAFNLNKVIKKEFERTPEYIQTNKLISKYIKMKEDIYSNYRYIFNNCGKNDEKRLKEFTKLDINWEQVKKHIFDDKKKISRNNLQKSYAQYLKTFKEYEKLGWEKDFSQQENAEFIKNKVAKLNKEEQIYFEEIFPFLDRYEGFDFDKSYETCDRELKYLNGKCLENICKKVLLSGENKFLIDRYLKLKKACQDLPDDMTFKYFEVLDNIVNEKLKNQETIKFEEQVNNRITDVINNDLENE